MRAYPKLAVAVGSAVAIAGGAEYQPIPQHQNHVKAEALAQPIAHIAMLSVEKTDTKPLTVGDKNYVVTPILPRIPGNHDSYHRHNRPHFKPVPYVAKKFDGCEIPSKPAHAATDAGNHAPVIYSLAGKNNEQKIFNYFLQVHLLNPVGASGIGGNAWQESHYSPLNPGGIATETGELWDHETMLAAAERRSPDELYVQLQDICQELTHGPYAYGDYRFVLENMRRAATPEDAAIQFMGPTPLSNGGVTDGFENPGIPAESVRTGTARAIYDELHHDRVAQEFVSKN